MKKTTHQLFGIDISIILLFAIVLFVFVFPAIDSNFMHDYATLVAYALVLLSIFSIIGKKYSWMKYIIVLATISIASLFFTSNRETTAIVFLISAITFTIATIILINEIAASKTVSLSIVILAISGYLLLGIIGTLINTIMLAYDPDDISISEGTNKFGEVMYYTFITLTTIGYGEIVPQSVTSRSISIFIGASGQIYLTVIIAMIVGKYISFKQSSE